MLRFDLSEIIRTPGMRQVYALNEPPYSDADVEFVSPVIGQITVTNTGTMLLVRGLIETATSMECSRCLEPVRVPLSMELEEAFDLKVIEDASHHDKVVVVVEDEIEQVFDGKVLKLDVLIRQAALLAAPLQPLCRETCPGIPIVGVDAPPDDESLQNSPFRDLSKFFEE